MKKSDFLKAKQGREHTKAAGAIPRTKRALGKIAGSKLNKPRFHFITFMGCNHFREATNDQ